MVVKLLHGTLHATIYEVDKIHYGWRFNLRRKNAGQEQSKKRFLSKVKKLVTCQPQAASKLYATIDLEKARVGRTRMIENEPTNPRWHESFRIYCAHTVSNIIFTVKSDDLVGATLIGRAYLPVDEIINGNQVDKWLPILDERHEPLHGSRIHVKLQFFDVKTTAQGCNWSQGIKTPSFEGVPYTYFLQRKGCSVSLYQDSHVPEETYEEDLVSSEGYYKAKRCWEDIFDAIAEAKYLIYIAGWSVYTNITLIRDPDRPRPGGDMILGELLKKKADEGVNVLILIWDDRTSVPAFKKDGLMATHDQETFEYFKDTKVHCFLCPRNPDYGRSIIQGFEISAMFTHHQKTLVVDSEILEGSSSEKRRIVGFLGGIDLCDGRYDTCKHSLFRTLNSVHENDFHQPNFPGSSIRKGGPREPWHDIHCKLEGPVAWDVLYNFEQRWKKQVGTQFLFSLDELDNFLVPPTTVTEIDDPETWNVQIFRSIDDGAASGFPKIPNKAAEIGLVSGKDCVIDRSIQDAYINAIRRAKNFVYIENQYFLGSSYDWNNSRDIKTEDIGALHVIPKELSLKIVSKIEAGERFSVYIVIPMWPEGIPESGSVQAILDWQRRTMETMYADIAEVLRVRGISETEPRDYLTFLCLGNREVRMEGEYQPPEGPPDPNSDYGRAQQARRFMIYVHAKMMIVDDEYIIIGSANINQRSMDGGRDTEIAMGAYQPNYLVTTQNPARGQVYCFRMALWKEHMNYSTEPSFRHPESLECIRRVKEIADENWKLYASNTTLDADLPRHILPYPVEISATGGVHRLPGFLFFPDTKARVLGTKSDYLPSILTT